MKRTLSQATLLPTTSPTELKSPHTNGMLQPHVLKYGSLVVLVLQNSSLVLMMRHSRSIASPSGVRYVASTAVVCMELVKLFICLFITYASAPSFRRWLRNTVGDYKRAETYRLLVPAALYAFQNNLLYLALTHLDAVTFQVTYQIKILTTALFSVGMLGRSLSSVKWFSLLMLMCGVAMVQLASSEPPKSPKSSSNNADTARPLMGLMAVLISCTSSGYAGVYFEKLLKTSSISLWTRNLHLATFSLVFASLSMLPDLSALSQHGFFGGYTTWTWMVILNQAMGGMIVAMVVKYADNLWKAFATSISIILSGIVAVFWWGFQPSGGFLFGAGLVITAVGLFSRPETLTAKQHTEYQKLQSNHIISAD